VFSHSSSSTRGRYSNEGEKNRVNYPDDGDREARDIVVRASEVYGQETMEDQKQ